MVASPEAVSGMPVRLFDVGPADEPEKLSADRRRTLKQRALIDAGIHPATRVALLPDGETCGTCVHFKRRRYSKTYFKCALVPDTRGAGSDIRKSLPACIQWEEGNDE